MSRRLGSRQQCRARTQDRDILARTRAHRHGHSRRREHYRLRCASQGFRSEREGLGEHACSISARRAPPSRQVDRLRGSAGPRWPREQRLRAIADRRHQLPLGAVAAHDHRAARDLRRHLRDRVDGDDDDHDHHDHRRRTGWLRHALRRLARRGRHLRAQLPRGDRDLPARVLGRSVVLQRQRRLRVLEPDLRRLGLLLGPARTAGHLLERLLPVGAVLVGRRLLRRGLVLGRRELLRLPRVRLARREPAASPSPLLGRQRRAQQAAVAGRSLASVEPGWSRLRWPAPHSPGRGRRWSASQPGERRRDPSRCRGHHPDARRRCAPQPRRRRAQRWPGSAGHRTLADEAGSRGRLGRALAPRSDRGFA